MILLSSPQARQQVEAWARDRYQAPSEQGSMAFLRDLTRSIRAATIDNVIALGDEPDQASLRGLAALMGVWSQPWMGGGPGAQIVPVRSMDDVTLARSQNIALGIITALSMAIPSDGYAEEARRGGWEGVRELPSKQALGYVTRCAAIGMDGGYMRARRGELDPEAYILEMDESSRDLVDLPAAFDNFMDTLCRDFGTYWRMRETPMFVVGLDTIGLGSEVHQRINAALSVMRHARVTFVLTQAIPSAREYAERVSGMSDRSSRRRGPVAPTSVMTSGGQTAVRQQPLAANTSFDTPPYTASTTQAPATERRGARTNPAEAAEDETPRRSTRATTKAAPPPAAPDSQQPAFRERQIAMLRRADIGAAVDIRRASTYAELDEIEPLLRPAPAPSRPDLGPATIVPKTSSPR